MAISLKNIFKILFSKLYSIYSVTAKNEITMDLSIINLQIHSNEKFTMFKFRRKY